VPDPPPEDAATSDASDASAAPDSGSDAGPGPSCTSAGSGTFAVCTPLASPGPIELSTLFAWPEANAALRPQLSPSSTPLVGNFTDDNHDGRIDLCDAPDVLVLTTEDDGAGSLHLISGASGTLHRKFNARVASMVTPALADLDRDGDIEVVTFSPEGQLLVIDHTGEVQVMGDLASSWGFTTATCLAVAIADLDGDDEAEIIGRYDVFDREGRVRFSYAGNIGIGIVETACAAPIAANIQGDDDLEVVFGMSTIQTSTGALISQFGMSGASFVAETSGGGLPELLAADGSDLLHVIEGGESAALIPDVCASHRPRPIALRASTTARCCKPRRSTSRVARTGVPICA